MADLPTACEEHQPKYKEGAWEDYTLAELGGIVAFFAKRSTHRDCCEKKAKDLTDAQNYLDMMQAKLDELKG